MCLECKFTALQKKFHSLFDDPRLDSWVITKIDNYTVYRRLGNNIGYTVRIQVLQYISALTAPRSYIHIYLHN